MTEQTDHARHVSHVMDHWTNSLKRADGKIAQTILSAMLLLAVVTAGLSRDADAQIQISSIEELQKIGNDPDYPLNGSYVLTQDIDASATASWNDGAGFNPIGIFTGNLNGQGYVVRELHIYRPDESSVGLFGRTGFGARIRNIGLQEVYVVGGSSVGGLLGSNQGHGLFVTDTESRVSNTHVTAQPSHRGLQKGRGLIIETS